MIIVAVLLVDRCFVSCLRWIQRKYPMQVDQKKWEEVELKM